MQCFEKLILALIVLAIVAYAIWTSGGGSDDTAPW